MEIKAKNFALINTLPGRLLLQAALMQLAPRKKGAKGAQLSSAMRRWLVLPSALKDTSRGPLRAGVQRRKTKGRRRRKEGVVGAIPSVRGLATQMSCHISRIRKQGRIREKQRSRRQGGTPK